jgi:hypothetical protein
LAQDTYHATMEASPMSIAMKSGISFESIMETRGLLQSYPKRHPDPESTNSERLCYHAADANFCYKHRAKKPLTQQNPRSTCARAICQERKAKRKSSAQQEDHLWYMEATMNARYHHPQRPPIPVMTEFAVPSRHSQHFTLAYRNRRWTLCQAHCRTWNARSILHLETPQTSYGGKAWTTPLPTQGIYQGTVDIMRQLGSGAFYMATLSGDTLRIAGFWPHTINANAEEVLKKLQEELNTWEGLVKASGGALSNDKSCWWYIELISTTKGTGGTKR